MNKKSLLLFWVALCFFYLALPIQSHAQQAARPYYSVQHQNNLILGPYDGSGSMYDEVVGSILTAPVGTPYDLDGDGTINQFDVFPGLEALSPGGSSDGFTRDIDRDGLPGPNNSIYSARCTGDATHPCNDEQTGYNRRSDLAFEVIRQVLDRDDDRDLDDTDDSLLGLRVGFSTYHGADWDRSSPAGFIDPVVDDWRINDLPNQLWNSRVRPAYPEIPFRPLTKEPGAGLHATLTDSVNHCDVGSSKIRYSKSVNPGQNVTGDTSSAEVLELFKALTAVTVLTNTQTANERSLDYHRVAVWPQEKAWDPDFSCRQNYQILITDGADNCAEGATYTEKELRVAQAAAFMYNYQWASDINLPDGATGVPGFLDLPTNQPALGGEAAVAPISGVNSGGWHAQTYVVGIGSVTDLIAPPAQTARPTAIKSLHLTARGGGTDANLDGDDNPSTFCIPDPLDANQPGVLYTHGNGTTTSTTSASATCALCKLGQSASECKGTAYFGTNLFSIKQSIEKILAGSQPGEYSGHQPVLSFSSTQSNGIWLASEVVGQTGTSYRFSNLRFYDLAPNLQTSLAFNATNIEPTPTPSTPGFFDGVLQWQIANEAPNPCSGVNVNRSGRECLRSLAVPLASALPAPGAPAEPFVSADVATTGGIMDETRLDLAGATRPIPYELANCDIANAALDENDAQCILNFARNDHSAPLGGFFPTTAGSGLRRPQDTVLGLTENKPLTTGPYDQFELFLIGQHFSSAAVNHSTDPHMYYVGSTDGALHAFTEDTINSNPSSLTPYKRGDEVWRLYGTENAVKELPFLRDNDRQGMNGQCLKGIFNLASSIDDAENGPTANTGDRWHRLMACAQGKDFYVLDLTTPQTPKTFGYVTLPSEVTMTPLLVTIKADPNEVINNPTGINSIQAPIIFVGDNSPGPVGNDSQRNRIRAYRADRLSAPPIWESPVISALSPAQPPQLESLMGFTTGDAFDDNSDLFADTFYFFTKKGLIFQLKVRDIKALVDNDYTAGSGLEWNLVYINYDSATDPDGLGPMQPVCGGPNTNCDNGIYNYASGVGGEDQPLNPDLAKAAQRMTAYYDNNLHLNFFVTFGDNIFKSPEGIEQIRLLYHGVGVPGNPSYFNENTGGTVLAVDLDPYTGAAPIWDAPGFPITFLNDENKSIADIAVVGGVAFLEYYDSRSATPCGKGKTIITGFNVLKGGFPFVDLDNNATTNSIVIPEAVASAPLISATTGEMYYAFQVPGTTDFNLESVTVDMSKIPSGLVGLNNSMF